MYDLVGQNFKINIGTGVFTKGPDGSQVENSVFLTDGICYLMKTTTGTTTFSHKLSNGSSAITNLPIYVGWRAN